MPEPEINLKDMTPEQLDQLRRDVVTEQERQQKLADGLAKIGATIRDYLIAAGVAVDADDETLGQAAIHAVS